jgi:hypothetical protein
LDNPVPSRKEDAPGTNDGEAEEAGRLIGDHSMKVMEGRFAKKEGDMRDMVEVLEKALRGSCLGFA